MNDAFAAALRAKARSALPPEAFLRRDRGEALYASDAPRRQPDLAWLSGLSDAGFDCRVAGGLAHITPAARWVAQLEAAFPESPDPLCEALRRFSGPPDSGVLALFVQGVKALDDGRYDAEFDRRLRQRAAVALRTHRPCGGLYACALVEYMMKKE